MEDIETLIEDKLNISIVLEKNNDEDEFIKKD